MTFHKGPLPGGGFKAEAKRECPRAVCRRKVGGYGGGTITGFVVTLDGREVVSAGSAQEAWRKFVNQLGTRKVVR